MRAREVELWDSTELRRQLGIAARGWLGRARRMKILIAGYVNKFREAGVRTDTDAELMSLAVYRLDEAIYNLNLIKQALIGL